MWKKILCSFLGLVLGAALALAWIVNRPYRPALTLEEQPPSNMEEAPEGTVWFESFHAAHAADILSGGAEAVHEPVRGNLFLPIGASADHPVPAVVILHGSGGDYTGRSENLARKLAEAGIAGFAVDTFESRGIKAEDDTFRRLGRVSVYSQIADALGALKALSRHPFIKAGQIGVAGFSLGASTALLTAFEPVAAPFLGAPSGNAAAPRFAAHIMFYGSANVDFEDFRTDRAPVLMMIGDRDETTPEPVAETMIEKLKAAGSPAVLKVYKGAAHGWDEPFPARYAKDAIVTAGCTALWRKNGEVVDKATGHDLANPFGLFLAFRHCARNGVTSGRNDAVNRRAVLDMLKFLEAHWGGDFVGRLSEDTLLTGLQPSGPAQ